jgi:hypothetical protein
MKLMFYCSSMLETGKEENPGWSSAEIEGFEMADIHVSSAWQEVREINS